MDFLHGMSIHVDIITPEKLALSDEVDFIAAPAFDGEIGILPGHTPLLTKLGVGELRLKKGEDVQYFAVSGGFLEVHKENYVQVFAETAEMADEIDVERAALAAEKAKSKLEVAKTLTPEELAQVEMVLSRAMVRLKVAQTRPLRRPKPQGGV